MSGAGCPLIEVPALVGLVYVALWLRHRVTRPEQVNSTRHCSRPSPETPVLQHRAGS
jgi:hypothetical protein